MAKGKFRNKNQEQEQDFGKKKKNIITQQLLMDKSNMDFTEFIPLLPSDMLNLPYNNIPETTTKALLKILTDLNYLLYLQPKNFWATVTYNISFQHCLSSCLSQLSSKWMNKYIYPNEQENQQDPDFPYRMVKDTDAYAYLQGLHDVLIKVVYRIMQFQSEDPQLNQIYNFGDNTIKKLNVFNVIKLMEMVEIYESREENHSLLKTISRNFFQTITNPYKMFIEEYLPHVVKKLQQNNRDTKLVSDRQEFGINYSYTRTSQKSLSPGEEQLKRKVFLLMNYISALKFFKNTNFLTEDIADFVYFNPQVNFVLENAFYELDAAYKIWSFQGVEKRLLPMLNHIFVELVGYFVEYFTRVDQRVVKRVSKQNVDAYVKSLQRFFVDYGKRYSLGKKGAGTRHMTLFKLVMKKINLVKILEELYVYEEEYKNYEFNMEYFIDFKLALEDTWKQDNYINEEDDRQHEVEEETQAPGDLPQEDLEDQGSADLDAKKGQENQQQQQSNEPQDPSKLKYFTPQHQDRLQFLVSKKSRQDDYYQALYLKQRQRCKIQYDDEYDDLVDYDKRPLFMDSASSDSDSEEEVKLQRLVSNQDNQKANQIKHIKFQQKIKDKKQQPKYTKVGKEQLGREEKRGREGDIELSRTIERDRQRHRDTDTDDGDMNEKHQRQDNAKYQRQENAKVKYVSKNNPQEKPQKHQKTKFVSKNQQKLPQNNRQRGNRLNELVQSQKLPEQGEYFQDEVQQSTSNQRGGYKSGGRGGQGGHKKRYVPVKTQDHKGYKEKGGNSNKNKEYGNETNQAYGGGKKYREKY